MLPQFRSQLLLHAGDDFLHDSVYLLVVHGLLLVLQDEVHGIALLSCGEVLALVDIE